jgi:ABC-type cobalamin/Fe3+-siderophores transport system ATPase subunit
MKKLKIKLENCYGIRKLNAEFDFSEKNVVSVYAPNGVMKTSFAKTFKDVFSGTETTDRIYSDRKTIREITIDTNAALTSNNILVIEPYIAEYASDKVSTLLVNEELRKEYEAIYEKINEKKNDLLKYLKKTSGLKNEQEIEENLSQDITNKKDFFTALKRIKDEINDYARNPKGIEAIQYKSIFNEKTIDLLKDQTIISDLSEYIATYDKLLDSSTFFKKGVFNHNNAADIAKRLKENGWFKANHSVNIRIDNIERKILNEKELEEAITKEKENIINNQDLQVAFEKLDKTLAKNQGNKDFRDYIEIHKDIIPELKEPLAFKEKLWIAYLSQNKAEYENILALYDESKERIQKIVDEAEKQSTKWQEVINEFNERYSVPFKLKMMNQSDVILADQVPSINFEFTDGDKGKQVDKETLLNVLSQGEKRALYILNILFEIKARHSTNQETLFIIDDIADSFDYKNKYAIIEYLKDIAKIQGFNLIILTHNFDFHRNVSSRLSILRSNRYCAVKYTNEIKLEEEKYQNNPFNAWKDFSDPKYQIAAIPFVRNLAEYCGKNDVFEDLTCLLHQKDKTSTITIENLEGIFKKLINIPTNQNFCTQEIVEKRIYNLANGINNDTSEKMELEDKVILSMAIRLKAENFLIAKINKKEFVSEIKENQTYKLVEKFKEMFPNENDVIRLMDKVNLMTPENIHINSFMYEPILDMSNEHLKKLYSNVSELHS